MTTLARSTRPCLLLALAAAAALIVAGCGPSRRQAAAPADVPGSASAAILSDATHAELEVRVLHAPGLTPSPTALSALQRELSARSHKAKVRVVVAGELPPGLPAVLSEEDLRALAAGRAPAPAGVLVLRVLYVRGESEEDAQGETHLGLSVSGDTIALFLEQVQAKRPVLATAEELEAAVLRHEAGHLMGLVGLGAPVTSAHQDPARRGHCSNTPCLMNAQASRWASLGLISTRLGAPEPAFCAACTADLRAAGARP